MAAILLVEDDPACSSIVADMLALKLHSVEVVASAEEAIQILKAKRFDMIVLDWSLPGKPGTQVCKEYRQMGGTAPVLMLTAKGGQDEKETGFNVGADDYLTKPFDAKEFLARIQALLRRPSNIRADVLKVRHVTLNTVTQQVLSAEQEVVLPRMEYALLEFFMRHPNQLFTPEEVLDRVWLSESDATAGALRKCLERLRAALDLSGQPSIITTVYGSGYLMRDSI